MTRPALFDVVPAVLAAVGVPAPPSPLRLAPARAACVLLVDGLGAANLADAAAAAPFLAGLASPLPGGSLEAGFPTTTATSLASLATGLPPGRHGMLGYTTAIPGAGRLLNALEWDDRVDPEAWQPHPTLLQRATAAGARVTRVAPAYFAESGLTRAALRGGAYAGIVSDGERVADALAGLSGDRPALVYVYTGDLDGTGHRRGWRSAAWRAQLAQIDRLVRQLAEGLPPGAALWVTADHGMVDVAAQAKVDVDDPAEAALRDGVALVGGEARARYLYTRRGAAGDVAATWAERLGAGWRVWCRDEAIAEGLFGPVDDGVRPRIGDVVAAAVAEEPGGGVGAVVTSRGDPGEAGLAGYHGGLSPRERRVPLLEVRAGG